MEAYLDDLRRVIVYVTIAGAAIPFIAWLLSRLIKGLQEQLFPPVTLYADVITKRLEVKAKDSNKKAYTMYFITFHPDGGKRKEYELPAKEFALSAPGDRGILKLHMGKFKSFTRL